MAVNLSPVGGAAAQFFDNSGQVLTGGLLYTYSAGTTTPAVTYTQSNGITAHPNPIVLNAAGRVPDSGEIWLSDGILYKFVLQDQYAVQIATWDNIDGINSNFVAYSTQNETAIATQGQIAFTLSSIQYTPATNSLAVYVNGNKQILTLNYVETSSTVVTFIDGLNVGDVVQFTTSVATSTNVVDSSNVAYTEGGTGAINTNVQTKLREYVSVLDFGADPTGVADSHNAFANAIATAKTVYVPKGTYNIGSPIVCTNPFKLVGDGVSSTVIQRNFSPTVDTNGIFTIQQGGTEICIRDMTLRSLTGQTGGCLLSIVPTVSGGMGLYNFSNIDFTTTGTSTHKYTLYFDGTAANTGAIGIRGLDMFGCSVFGGATSTMLVKGVLKFSFVGGGCYPAGGASTSNVNFDGTATVPTQSFQFLPADCSCDISFGYTTLGFFSCGIMGAVTNTTNSSYINGRGYSASVQNNWLYSNFFNPQTGLIMTGGGGISNTGAAPAGGGIEMYGSCTGNLGTNVTHIGQVGTQNTTLCPNTKTITFTSQSGKLFNIATGGGAGVLVFADFKSSTITLISNPSTEFVASTGPSSGFTNIYKSANSHVISVTNNTGSSITYSICAVGTYVSAVTDPT